ARATLAIALVTAQVSAVVAMPFSLQDDLSPTFMFHFYEALADGRTLEEALSRARQALLPMQHKSWFIPVLYRHVAEGEEIPVPLITVDDIDKNSTHPLAYLSPPVTFVGRKRELQDLDELLTAAASGQQKSSFSDRLHAGAHQMHHIALTGSPGIGKSALACEVVRRNRDKFPGGVIGVSLQNGKLFVDALAEIIHLLHLPQRNLATLDTSQRARQVQGMLHSLASRELNCLLLLDGFEEVRDRTELGMWLQFLSALPQEVVVIVTSLVNPLQYPLTDRWNEKTLTSLPTTPDIGNFNRTMPNMSSGFALGGPRCHWYEYHLGKMTDADLLTLFTVLAEESGLDRYIHLHDPMQQAILHEICTLLDGYPLGAELIFGTARSVDGKVYMPEAATRSLEEVRDELCSTPLAGMQAVLEISYHRLTPLARLLLAYLSAFKLPFNREQIMMLVTSVPVAAMQETMQALPLQETVSIPESSPETLLQDWRAGRDELVQASFIQFDGHAYTIHSQVRHFALIQLPLEERRRIHRLIAAYYRSLSQPRAEEMFAAFEHLEAAGETQDLQEAIQIAAHAVRDFEEHSQDPEWQAMLRRAELYAARLSQEPQTQSS
ncbi:MAG TPA: CHAT domain-containing protein, partial [Ktedonobacteraceae bacterium]|nr:CHAT domain-containing protein [Ktedonobacteraceae bacterium]